MVCNELDEIIDESIAEIIQENAVIDKPFVEKNNLTKVIGLLVMIGRSTGAKELKPGQSDVLDSLHGLVKFKGKVRSFMASNKKEIAKLVTTLRTNASLTKLISKVLSKKGLLGKGGIFEDFSEIKSRKQKLIRVSIGLEKLLSVDQQRLLDSIYHVATYGEVEKPFPPEFAFNNQIRARQNTLDSLLKQIEDLRMSLIAEAIRTGNHNARILLSEVISSEDYNAMIDLNLGDPRWKKLYRKLAAIYHPDKNASSAESNEDFKAIGQWMEAMKNRSYPELDNAKELLAQRAGVATASTAGSSYDSGGSSSSYGHTQQDTQTSSWSAYGQSTGNAYQDMRQDFYDQNGRWPEDPEPQPEYVPPRSPYEHDENYDWFSDPYYADNPWREETFRKLFNRAPNWNDYIDRLSFENEYENRQNFYDQHGRYPEDPEPQPEPQPEPNYGHQQQDYDWSSTQYNTPRDEETREKIYDMLNKAGLAIITPPAYVYIGFMWLMYHMGVPDFHGVFDEQPQLIKVLYDKLVKWGSENPRVWGVVVGLPKAMYNTISSLVIKVVKSELTKTALKGLGIALMAMPKGVMLVLQKIISQMTLKNLLKLDPRRLKKLYDKLAEKIPSGADVKTFSKEKINSFIDFVTPNPKEDSELSEKDIAKQVEKIAKSVHDKSKLMKQFQDHLEKSVTDGELTTRQAVKLASEHLAKLDDMISNAQVRLRELALLVQVKKDEEERKRGETQAADKKTRTTQAKKKVRGKFADKFDAKFESVV